MAINSEIIKDILRHNDITNSEDILIINYETESGKGTFKIFMPDRFPTTAHNIKIFIDMFHKALDNGATARVLYDYLVKCREFLNDLKERTPDYTDDDKKTRAALAGHIKKYDSNIATLAKDFNFETIKTDAVKMQKVNLLVDRMENGRRKAVNKKGYRFIKAGHVFHVYKENRTCFVIVPCCGLAIANYEGNINAAPEYINENVLHLMNNRVDRLAVAYNSTVYYNIMEPRRATQGHTTPYKATISHDGITCHTRPHKAVIRSYNAPPLARCPGATSKAATPRYYNTS